MLEYRGYAVEVELDESVGRPNGWVVNSGPYPIGTFGATDVERIRREFHRSIDEHLESCREDGVEPSKPHSGKLNVRLGPGLHRRVARSVPEGGLSLNSWITQVPDISASR